MANIRMWALLQDSAVSKEAFQFVQFLLQVGEGKVSFDAGSYLEVVHFIYKICSCKEPRKYIYEDIEEKHIDNEWLKRGEIITTRNISL